MTTIGGLFAGYGGLEMGVQSVLGGELAWYADCCKFDKNGNAGHYEPHRAPCSIQAHHNPGVPNLGDVTAVDWGQVEPVDILTGGSPCQDLSHAGKRAGMTEGTRSNLWVAMREAIAQLRPSLVVWENVRGAYSACADSDLGRCPRCVDSSHPGGHAPLLRALGRVLGDLSDLGYDAGWHGLRAADVGAPHGRMRVFVTAYPRELGRDWRTHLDGTRRLTTVWGEAGDHPRDTGGALLPTPRATDGTKGGPNQRGSSGDLMLPSAVAGLLPTPTTQDASNNGGPSQHDRNSLPLNAAVALLPTPAVNDMGAAYTPDEWDAWTDRMKAEHGNGNGNGKSLSIEAARLLPTPTTTQRGPDSERDTRTDAGPNLHNEVTGGQWGDYDNAIARWEHTTGRPAPAPTMTSTKGNPQLAPAFVEWMMGLPAGHVTDTPGITRNEALKALGNGVVPQQAEAALRFLLGAMAVAA